VRACVRACVCVNTLCTCVCWGECLHAYIYTFMKLCIYLNETEINWDVVCITCSYCCM